MLWDSPSNTSGDNEERYVDLLNDHFLTQTNNLVLAGNWLT